VQKAWSSCTAYAPADWTTIGNEERVGMGVDLTSADRSMSASLRYHWCSRRGVLWNEHAEDSDYNSTGPDGPGYYRKVGSVGGYEKLSEGFRLTRY